MFGWFENTKGKRLERVMADNERLIAQLRDERESARFIREGMLKRTQTRRTMLLEAGYLDLDLIDTMSTNQFSSSGDVVRQTVVLQLDLTREEAEALRRGVRGRDTRVEETSRLRHARTK